MNRPRIGWVVSALLSLGLLLACDDGSHGEAGGPPGSVAPCVPGELTLSDGSCQPAGLPPDMRCPPGESALPAAADGGCQPAGVPAEACAAGRFVSDGRGGCAPILPEEACPSGQMAVPGERACRDVAPCGEGTWGDIPVETTTEYVDQGYSGNDSDGSRAKPWKTVQEGVRSASPGAIVAVAEGRYEEDVLVLGKPVRLWGRCPSRAEVVGLGSQSGAIVIAREGASGSEVRGLAVTGPSAGIAVRDARAVVIEAVWVHEAADVGVLLLDRAGVTVRGALLERNLHTGVYVYGAEAIIDATLVRATQLDSAGEGGRGIGVEQDPDTRALGKLSLTTSLLDQNHEVGVFVGGAEATVEATVVRATQPGGDGKGGSGLSVERRPETGERGKLSLTASLVEQNHKVGVFVEGSEATVESTVVRATQPDGTGAFGRGIGIESDPQTGEGGTLSLKASLVEENHEVGVLVIGSEAAVEATVVRANQPDSTGEFGHGIGVEADSETGKGGKLSLVASRVEENQKFGIYVIGSEVTVEATVVRATRPDSVGEYGRGINAQADLATGERGKLSLTASLVEENHDIGVFVAGPEATIEATLVRTTKPAPSGEAFGDGILVMDERGQSSASIVATASTDNFRAGVMYVGSTGGLLGVRSSGNRFGLVLQDGKSGARPTFGEDSAFESNTEKDQLIDGGLAVPDAVQPIP